MTKWSRWFLPVWTLFLGILIGGLDGGLSGWSNWGAVLLFVLCTAPVWIVGEIVSRRARDADSGVNRPGR
ncbi:hypothetical protein [Cellulomonas triticagri]|uniref:hypothetical protein n=1 Tax=Cellulomonas triticagri TaxID=2483352 RepID=UPI0011C47D98|nr:hypothetical protein [Cellulomonas triticagri]